MQKNKPRKANLRVYDEIYTPTYAVEPLRKFLEKAYNMKDMIVWECCDIESGSKIMDVFRSEAKVVIGTSLKGGLDFLKNDPPFDYDIIITNPPYSIKDDFIKRAFELGKPFAFLLPIDALAGKARHELYKKYNISALVLDTRIDFTGNKKPHTNSIWLLGNIFLNNMLVFGELKK